MATDDRLDRAGTDAADLPLPLYRILEEECRALHPDEPAAAGPAAGVETPSDRDRLQAVHHRLDRFGHHALCFSGGGIRSASFALGALQGLAQRRLLEGFDYLSTVSGGGFAGGWLTAWLHHAAGEGDRDAVFRQLRGDGLPSGATEAVPVRRVRLYSRYMSPQLGSLSADTWTIVATMLRNVLLNWMVLLPLVAAGLLVPHAYLEAVQYFDQPLQPGAALPVGTGVLLTASLGLLLTSLAFVVIDLPSYGNGRKTQAQFLGWCLGPLCLGTLGLTVFWAVDVVQPSLAWMTGAAVAASVTTWVLFGLVAGTRRFRPRTWLAAALSAPIGAAGIWALVTWPFGTGVALGPLYCTAALPLALGVFALMAVVFVALASADHTEADLEWHARHLAWILIAIVAWLATTSLVFYAPDVFRAIQDFLRAHWGISDLHSTGLLGGAASALGAGVAYLLRQPQEPAATRPSRVRAAALGLAAPTFAVLLLGGLAWINVVAVGRLYALGVLRWLRLTPAGDGPDATTGAEVIAVGAALVLVGLVMARFVPVNRFSLHGMYRDRLVRAFLGASRPEGARRPDPFTGFDPRDNVPMHALGHSRPLHVVNMTLNIVAEKGLATQFRKAESFTLTPLHSGSARLDAYRPTREYADERAGGNPVGISLGTALAISGAAASPNMGSRSSPPLTFLMTMFNARLGVWLGNPGAAGRATWRRSEPGLGVGPMLRELFGRTTDRNPYVYLSDGGHFENLGLWEMVLRRCRGILVSDAGCDPQYAFADLATAVRSIRIDLGVPIVFDDGIPIDGARQGRGNPHFAVGRIQYSAVDGPLAEDGVLIYVKATLSGNEPVDVANYATQCPAFPHESTANQWFSEAQFESYRMLGLASIASIAPDFDGRGGLKGFFEAARQPAPPRRLPPVHLSALHHEHHAP
jgi:hypothetical protein